jgi:hypothetical protein
VEQGPEDGVVPVAFTLVALLLLALGFAHATGSQNGCGDRQVLPNVMRVLAPETAYGCTRGGKL